MQYYAINLFILHGFTDKTGLKISFSIVLSEYYVLEWNCKFTAALIANLCRLEINIPSLARICMAA